MSGLHLKYFVLNPNSSDKAYALASQAAMLTFAFAIENVDFILAEELRDWVSKNQKQDYINVSDT